MKKRITIGTFGLDIAELIEKRFNEEKKLQNKGKRNRMGTMNGVCLIKRGRGRRIQASGYCAKDGIPLEQAQRIKLYIDIPMN